VLDEQHGEDALGKTIIETDGVAHHITFAVDHIKQEPKITHTTKPSSVIEGTKITVNLPSYKGSWQDAPMINTIADCEEKFLELAESYAWLNPHLTLRESWNGERKIDIKASNPTWKKWLPSWPTSAHWYDVSRFRRYMAAHIAHRDDITVREFISEFLGLSATAKQKQILMETGASHVSLHNFFGLHKANTANITKLLTALKRHSKVVQPAELGIIGKDHLFAMLEKAGGNSKTFTYQKRLGETGGLPRVVEVAFGVDERGLRGRGPSRKEITGVNWSPGINNPFRQLGRRGAGLDEILSEVRASSSKPIIIVIHVACPRVAYTDRGKSAIVVEGEFSEQQED
jgi:DNA topoisomerase VI subunit B